MRKGREHDRMVSCRMAESLRARCEALATRQGISLSEWLRRAAEELEFRQNKEGL